MSITLQPYTYIRNSTDCYSSGSVITADDAYDVSTKTANNAKTTCSNHIPSL